MTKKRQTQRFIGARHDHRTIYFRQIRVDGDRELCHRDSDALKADKIEGLSTSLAQEDLATPFSVYETTATVDIGGQALPVYCLFGGFRRHEGIEKNIRDNIDTARFHEMMHVPVVVLVRGEHQSAEEYAQDILVRSVVENEQRASFTQSEKLGIVAAFVKAKVPKPRGASALGLSETQFDRYARVVNLPWLHDGVNAGHIGLTDAANVAETAANNKRLTQFKSEYDTWVSDKTLLLERERETQEKLGRELKGPAALLKKYLDAATVKTWKDCLKNGESFIGAEARLHFGVVVDETKGTFEISRYTAALDKMHSSHTERLICEFSTGLRTLVKLRSKQQARERVVDLTDEQIEVELRELEQLALAEAAEKAAREEGRDPAEEAVIDEEPESVAEAIDQALRVISLPRNAALESVATTAPGADERDADDLEEDGDGHDAVDQQEDQGQDAERLNCDDQQPRA
jgi:hypothetical protein